MARSSQTDGKTLERSVVHLPLGAAKAQLCPPADCAHLVFNLHVRAKPGRVWR
jgi:hypothetical protein